MGQAFDRDGNVLGEAFGELRQGVTGDRPAVRGDSSCSTSDSPHDLADAGEGPAPATQCTDTEFESDARAIAEALYRLERRVAPHGETATVVHYDAGALGAARAILEHWFVCEQHRTEDADRRAAERLTEALGRYPLPDPPLVEPLSRREET